MAFSLAAPRHGKISLRQSTGQKGLHDFIKVAGNKGNNLYPVCLQQTMQLSGQGATDKIVDFRLDQSHNPGNRLFFTKDQLLGTDASPRI